MKQSFKNRIATRILTGIKSPLFTFYVLIFILCLIEYCVFVNSVGGFGQKKIVFLAKCIGEIALVLCPYWLIPNRYKWSAIICQSLLSIFFLANTWYYGYFREFIPALSYRLTGNLDGTLFSSICGIIKFSDLLYIIAPIISLFIYYCYYRNILKKCAPLRIPIKISAISISFILFIIAQCGFIVTDRHYYRDIWGKDLHSLKDLVYQRLDLNSRHSCHGQFRSEGLVLYFLRASYDAIVDISTNGGKIRLSDEMIDGIDRYIQNTPKAIGGNEFNQNREKNLVLVLVESLNSYMVNKKIGDNYLTPVMNGLINSPGTISTTSMHSQIKSGISNDGQLIVNTGLLPIDKGVVMMNFGNNLFPTLNKLISPARSIVIFGDNGQTWNQTGAFRSFGFSEIYSELDFHENADEIGNDAAMFNLGVSKLKELSQPFFMEFVTFSSHTPFADKGVDMPGWIKENGDLEPHEKNYYSMINYFDTQLGRFIDNLKNQNLWDNTILIVTSDHSLSYAIGKNDNPSGEHLDLTDIPIVFIAANTGITRKIETPSAQVNVFPTILQIMDATPREGYRGLGRTLLDPDLKSAVDSKGKVWGTADSLEINRQRDAFRISDLIHRGNYFGIRQSLQN